MQPVLTISDEFGNEKEINNITSSELDLLLYLSLRQDSWGKVVGVHYKDVMLKLGFRSKQTFYNAIHGLEEKNYIQINYRTLNKYWECTILGNIFQNEEDDKEGYFNTNREFLFTRAFRDLKVNEKKICIKLSISYQNDHFDKYGLQVYPATIANWIGLKSVSLVYRYMENICDFFPSIRKDGIQGELFYLPKGNLTPFRTTRYSERENHLTHKLKYFCSTFRIAYTLKDLRDLIVLMAQYAKKGIGKVYGTICDVLLSKRSIEPKLINSILSGKNESLEIYTG